MAKWYITFEVEVEAETLMDANELFAARLARHPSLVDSSLQAVNYTICIADGRGIGLDGRPVNSPKLAGPRIHE